MSIAGHISGAMLSCYSHVRKCGAADPGDAETYILTAQERVTPHAEGDRSQDC